METIDLYNGISRAIESVKPAQEFCFLGFAHWSTCLTKSEWASWIQAFGILSFLYVPWVLKKLRRRSLKDALEDIIWKIHKSKNHADAAYKHLEKNCRESSYETASGLYVIENIKRLEDIDAHAISVIEIFSEISVRQILEFNKLKGEILELGSLVDKVRDLDFYTLMDIEIKCAHAAFCLESVEKRLELIQKPALFFGTMIPKIFLGLRRRFNK